MTETEKTSTNGAANGKADDPKLTADIVRQVEHYFGDFSLPRDKFLLEKIKENEDGWVDMEIMLKFQRLSNLSKDADVILKALKTSDSGLLEIDAEAKKIRRSTERPLPELTDERKKEVESMTLYCKGFDKENTTLDELLEFFKEYKVLNVNKRMYTDRKTDTKGFKGSVFVTFSDKESAEKFLKLEEVKYKDAEIIRKWQSEYFVDKQKEREEGRKKKKEEKKKAKGEGDDADETKEPEKEKEKEKEAEEEVSIPKGAVLHLEGFGADTMREDIKKVLQEDFEVDCDKEIAWNYYSKGEKEAKIRFHAENAAKNIAEKLKAKGDTVKIKDEDITYKVLEGEEEEEFIAKCITDIKDRKRMNKRNKKGHKRKSWGGGGANKRQRRN